MDAKIIQKYQNKSLPNLISIATGYFNAYIRSRDAGERCISCDSIVEQAGHFYSGGHYSALKFNEDNVNGQCKRCNYFLSGNLNEYRKRLIKKIGEERLRKLDDVAAYYTRVGFKWDRFALIEIITSYKQANVQKEIKEKTCIQGK